MVQFYLVNPKARDYYKFLQYMSLCYKIDINLLVLKSEITRTAAQTIKIKSLTLFLNIILSQKFLLKLLLYRQNVPIFYKSRKQK